MGTKVDFLYLSEPDMVKAGVKDMKQCVEVMERLLVTLNKGDYVMGGKNHNSHGCMIMFPDDPQSWQCQPIWAANTRWQG